MIKKKRLPLIRVLFLIVLAATICPAGQQDSLKKNKDGKEKVDKEESQTDALPPLHYQVTVTATRQEKPSFQVPNPVSVSTHERVLMLAPNTVADLLTQHPGIDITGVGPNQTRPIIRGLRGQRILLLENGLRLNSARRQQDFGEITGMIDVDQIDRVEIVRGPASVLYGSDAMGGVINIISRPVHLPNDRQGLAGSLGWRYDSADRQSKETANLIGRFGNFHLQLNASYRKAGEYEAPAGQFGNIVLQQDTPVSDSGLQDHTLNLATGWQFKANQSIEFKVSYYNANDAGFGFIEPKYYAPAEPRIRIQYPYQTFMKYVLKYEHRDLNSLLADGFNAQVYFQQNTRRLNMDIFIPINPRRLAVGVGMKKENFTDIATIGFRLEATKVVGTRHILTYGSDFFSDATENTDIGTTTMIGMGPVQPQVDHKPEIPDAHFSSLGFFVQDDVKLLSRLCLVAGLRYQDVLAHTKEMPELPGLAAIRSSDRTWTGSANLLYRLTSDINLTVSIGRAFRSPNLIERYFNGVTPEGRGFQIRNPELQAETSLNIDLGCKYRLGALNLEGYYFFNTITNGIRVLPTSRKVNGLDEYQNVNIDKLRLQGLELQGEYRHASGLYATINFAKINSKDLLNPELPYTSTFSSKWNVFLGYQLPRTQLHMEYHFRHNGKQQNEVLQNNPIGPTIPAFSTHDISISLAIWPKNRFPMRLSLLGGNLTNKLYAEFSNASFFRPAQGRHLTLNWSVQF